MDPPAWPTFNDLPVEVLSIVASLLSPPFYPPTPEQPPPLPHSSSSSDLSIFPSPTPSPNPSSAPPLPPLAASLTTPPAHLIAALDPRLPVPPPQQTINALTKVSPRACSGARPWLWESVDIKTGRGWLSVVDALTEVVDDSSEPDTSGFRLERIVSRDSEASNGGVAPGALPTPISATYTTSPSQPIPFDAADPPDHAPAPPLDAHTAPNTVPGGFARYVSFNPSLTAAGSIYPGGAFGSSSASDNPSITFGTSPPQPPRLGMLFTPPGSRNASPSGQGTDRQSRSRSAARLRGRSRSPRRALELELGTEGIQAVLDRSRSASGSARDLSQPPLKRRTSLSVSRTATLDSRFQDDEDEGDDERDGDGAIEELKESVEWDRNPHHLNSPPFTAQGVVQSNTGATNVNPDLLPTPGPFIRHLNFTHFHTLGTGRSQDEAVRGRFVTAGRFEGVIKNAPNLRSLCMTEYVDSALSYPVLEELFFRGYTRPRTRHPRSTSFSPDDAEPVFDLPPSPEINQLDPPRPIYVPYEDENEEQKWERRAVFHPLEALDLTGCVSHAFAAAIDEFGETWLAVEGERGRSRSRHLAVAATSVAASVESATSTEDESDAGDYHRRGSMVSTSGVVRRLRRAAFPGMKRISLRNCMTLTPAFIHSLVLCLPCLTHLDLSGTRVPSTLFSVLTRRPPATLKLQSLSLARCPRIDPAVIANFLCYSSATTDIVELNLFVNPSQGNALGADEITQIINEAPCFKSGNLTYLDLSSSEITATHLNAFPPQPSLLSLGLSHIPSLALKPIGTFLASLAPNVEVLTLTGTAAEADLRPGSSSLQIMLALHGILINPLTTVPFSLSKLDLAGTGGNKPGIDLSPGPTRLRVIELSSAIRRVIAPGQGGRSEWQVVKSKGARGWYVDVSAGWIQNDQVKLYGSVDEVVGDFEKSGEGKEEQEDEGVGMTFVRHLPLNSERRRYLASLAEASGRVRSDVGWHSRKMEIVKGEGMLGREGGLGGVGAFAFEEA